MPRIQNASGRDLDEYGAQWRLKQHCRVVMIPLGADQREAQEELDLWLSQLGVRGDYLASITMWGLHCGTWFTVHLKDPGEANLVEAALQKAPWPDPYDRRGGAPPPDGDGLDHWRVVSESIPGIRSSAWPKPRLDLRRGED